MMATMHRGRLAWLSCLSLMAVGGFLAHSLAYRLVVPTGDTAGRVHEIAHAQPAHWRTCLSICVTLAVVVLAASIARRAKGGGPLRPPLLVFALLPPLGFVVQEHLERLLHTGAFPDAAALEPTFLVGLLLQLPFALAAYLAARALFAAAAALARTLGAQNRPRLASLAAWRRPASEPARPCISTFALGGGQRAPPALVFVG